LASSRRIGFVLAPNGTAYFVVAAVSRAGIALLGDEGKFVPDAANASPPLDDEPDRLIATVNSRRREIRALFGYATRAPRSRRKQATVGDVALTSEWPF